MSVEFDEEALAPVRRNSVRPQSVFTKLVLKSKLAKTEKGAQYVLLALGVAAFAGALFIFFDLGSVANSAPSPVPSAQWPT
ncbi:MAG TPA: hypothetical protein VFY28_00320 [Candidatus Paceibacterota bacterium]|nr:hypothetical protein [Candidatus Paceibacterota bacterium]